MKIFIFIKSSIKSIDFFEKKKKLIKDYLFINNIKHIYLLKQKTKEKNIDIHIKFIAQLNKNFINNKNYIFKVTIATWRSSKHVLFNIYK